MLKERNRQEGEGGRAVTTCSIDFMYFTEESDVKEKQKKGQLEKARRPIIVGVDSKRGGVNAHKVKCTVSGDFWIATRTACDIEESGYGRLRVILKADQEIAIIHARKLAKEKQCR